jgi:hypothetical protein
MRRADVFLADARGLLAHAAFQRVAGRTRGIDVGALLRIQQAFVILARELRIDRQPHGGVAAGARELHRELDPLVAVGNRRDVGRVLVGRQHLLEQSGQLHLAEHAARLDVGQHALQATDIGGELVHVAQAAMHLRQHGGDVAEALGQSRLQRGVQLLVHGRAHLLQLGGVVRLQLAQARLERDPHVTQPGLVVAGELGDALVQRGGEIAQRQPLLGAGLARVLVQGLPQQVQSRAEAVDALLLLQRQAIELLSELTAAFTLLGAQCLLQRQPMPVEQDIRAASQQRQQQADDDSQGEQCE